MYLIYVSGSLGFIFNYSKMWFQTKIDILGGSYTDAAQNQRCDKLVRITVHSTNHFQVIISH